MRIIRTPEITKALLDTIRQRGKYDEIREGIHLSDLLYCNYKTLFRKRGQAPSTSNAQVMMFTLGYALQFMLFPKNKEEEVYEIDGIKLRPDVDNQYLAGVYIPLAEVKSTRVNMKRFDVKEYPQYIEQMMGYCKAKKETFSYLFVYFVVGDYNPPFPAVDTWRLDFTQTEIDNKWQEFLERKTILEEALRTGEMPKRHYMGFKKECSYCEIKEICPIQNNIEKSLDKRV